MKSRFFYIIELQYLGFRYHGWQRQPKVKTVQEMVHKTLKWVLPNYQIKVLASGRTDAMVSATHTLIEIFLNNSIEDKEAFLYLFNKNLPADIRALSIKTTTKEFNVILASQFKEYHYYFCYGAKPHPYAAALMAYFPEKLDISIMQRAAKLFEGKKDFFSYCFRPTKHTNTHTEIYSCELIENQELTASFFPNTSYVLKVKGNGFKRNQIRLMVGMLVDLGRNYKDWDLFIKTLNGNNKIKLDYIAPASGLHLHKVIADNTTK